MLLYMSVLTMAAFVFSATLYAAGYGTVRHEAAERLARLRGSQPTGAAAVLLRLRSRASINLGGLSLVSGTLVQRWTTDLDRAGLTLNAREYFMLRVGVSVVLVLLGFVLSPIPIISLALAPVGYFVVGLWLKRRITQRRFKLEGQLAELLETIASGLRAGFGFMQALEAGAEQMPPPMSTEIRRTLRDVAIGASVEDALQAMNTRVGSTDLDITITAVLIQRSVGGNLAEILESVAHTMRERDRIRGEIRTLTAQGRLGGYVIGGLPIALILGFTAIAPDFIKHLFTDPWGQAMLGGAVFMEILGFISINKIVNIEV